MNTIGYYIPSIEELTQRSAKPSETPPSETARREMTQYLTSCGYRGENPQVFDAIMEYGAAESEGKNHKGLFLRGACGIGKSYGVYCLAAKFQWLVISAKQLQAAFMSYDDDAFLKLVDGIDWTAQPNTIVIDDIGTEDCPIMKYGTATNIIADVLDRRYYMGFHRHNVRTIVTCNLSDEQLKERYGLRLDDRLNEMFKFATVNGKSLRK